MKVLVQVGTALAVVVLAAAGAGAATTKYGSEAGWDIYIDSAMVKAFLAARWPLADGGYEEELPRCIADLAAMPDVSDLLAEAKTLLPQLLERIEAQPTKDRAAGEVDPKRIIADWCARQTEKTALCD